MAALLLLTVPLLAACREPQTRSETGSSPVRFDYGQPEGMIRSEYAEYLSDKAGKLAQRELARLSAIELMYRNKTYYHEFFYAGVGIQGGAYAKLYRQFTDYTLIDITHSDSLLRPITFAYEFTYDLIGTDPVVIGYQDPKSAREAHANQDFHFYRTGTVKRRYDCDENGEPLGDLPLPPPRPNYWDNGKSSMQQFSIEEPLIPL